MNLAQSVENIKEFMDQAQENYNSDMTQTLGVLYVVPPGCGIFRDNILMVGGQLAPQVNSCNKLSLKMFQLYEILNFKVNSHFHLEDKVNFKAMGNDKYPTRLQ